MSLLHPLTLILTSASVRESGDRHSESLAQFPAKPGSGKAGREPNTVSLLSPVQILTGVYLAGVLFPCLVTALTISREQSPKFTLELMVRQAIAAIVFALILAWGGYFWW